MRLIDADALLKHQEESDRIRGVMLVVSKGYILDAPTIEPPVVHARWVGKHGATCSVCGDVSTRAFIGEYPKYCQNCGARMDSDHA